MYFDQHSFRNGFFIPLIAHLIIKIIIIIIITYLTRVNLSAKAVINGCPGQLKNNKL